MFFFLFKHKDAKTDDKYVFSVGEMKIKLSANQSNPISKGLINAPVLSTWKLLIFPMHYLLIILNDLIWLIKIV